MRPWLAAMVGAIATLVLADSAPAVAEDDTPQCICKISKQPAEEFEGADLVFFGRASRFHRGTGAVPRAQQFWEFEVEGVWKGPAQRSIRIYAHDFDGAEDCDKSFQLGTSYVVYAYLKKRSPNRYRVSRCSRTTTAERSLRDLGFLGRPKHEFSQ